MSKNLTRKGLALGAVVALGSSLFAGAPAFAANEVNLQPTLGTTYGTILGETFSLSANIAPGYSESSIAKLKYNVVNATKGALTFVTPTSGSQTVVDADNSADHSRYVVTPGATSSVTANTLTIATAATTASNVTVTAWIDSDLDSVIDAGEWTSTAQTVVFNKASDVTWSTEFTAPAIGDTKFTAYVTTSPAINYQALAAGRVKVLFTNKGLTPAATVDEVELLAASYDSTTGKLKANDVFEFDGDTGAAGTITAVTAATRYTAQAAYHNAGTAVAADVVGSAATQYVAAATIDAISDVATANSDNTVYTDSTTPAFAVTVRNTATTVAAEIAVTNSGVAVKSAPVTVYLEENAVGGTDTNATTAVGNYDSSSFVAGGVTLKDTTTAKEKVSFTATTDADGKIKFNIASTAQAGDAIKVWASAQGVNATPTKYTVYTWAKPTVASVANTNASGTNSVLKAAAGATVNLDYAVVDNFGALLQGAGYRVAVTNTTDTVTKYGVVSAGRASTSWALASDASGTKTINAEVQVLAADGNYYDLNSNPTVADRYADKTATAVSLVVGTSNAVANLAVNADLAVAGTSTDALSTSATNAITLSTRTSKLDKVAFVAGDTRTGGSNSVKGTATTGLALAGTVTDAATAATYGTVTFSGANLNFIVTNSAGGSTHASGTVTVQTDASGAFSGVRVLTNIAGDKTLTVTSGSVTKSFVIAFGDADVADAATYSVVAPATIKAGRTLVITATAVDAFGNKVAEVIDANKFTYTGPGFATGSAPTAANSSYRVLLGASDTGAATVSVTFRGADNTAATSDDVTITKTILIGVSASVSAGSKKATSVVKGAEGLTVKVVSGTKSVTKVATSDSYKVTLSKLTSGSKTVKVYVEGILVASKKVTVKK